MPQSQVTARTLLYCVQGDIEAILSQTGIRLRLDKDGDGQLDATEIGALNYVISGASDTIDFYCSQKHTQAYLVQSTWVNYRCAILATYDACKLAANPVPEAIEDWADRVIEDELKKIRYGTDFVPNIPLARKLAPVFSNTRCDPNYQFRVIRVERQQSTDSIPTGLRQNTDYADAFTLEV